MALRELIESDKLEAMKEQLDRFKSVLSLADNELLNDRSKQSIVLQASGEFDKFTILVSDYYGLLATAALHSTKPKEDEPKMPKKKKESSSEEETKDDSSITKPKLETRGRTYNRSVKL